MKRITVRGLQFQFDLLEVPGQDIVTNVKQTLEVINCNLQQTSQPYAAQLFPIDEIALENIEIEEIDEESFDELI